MPSAMLPRLISMFRSIFASISPFDIQDRDFPKLYQIKNCFIKMRELKPLGIPKVVIRAFMFGRIIAERAGCYDGMLLSSMIARTRCLIS
jgi:hypothetical protein